MAIEFTFEVDPNKKFAKALEQAKKYSVDLKIPFTLIAQDFYRSQKPIWELGGPGRYKPISESYKTSKQKKYGFVYPLLKANGYLERAATTMNGAGNVTIITDEEVVWGVDVGAVPYAAYHQSDEPRSKIPLRKFLFGGSELSKWAVNADQLNRPKRWLDILRKHYFVALKDVGEQA